MKKNLIKLFLGLIIICLSAASLIAKSNNSASTLKKINAVESKASLVDYRLAAKIKRMKQDCSASAQYGYTCSEAWGHFAGTLVQAYDGCEQNGWDSDYCSQLMKWVGDTAFWAMRVCNDEYMPDIGPVSRKTAPKVKSKTYINQQNILLSLVN